MTVAQLAHPEWLAPVSFAFGLAVAALALAAWRARRNRRALVGPARAPAGVKWTSDAALLVALAAIAVALLGPRIGQRSVAVSADGVDLVVLVDVSRSMDAPDNPPSRLERARRGIEEILERLEPSDRVALAAFAGRGVLLAPLTPDHSALAELVRALDTDLIQPAASDLDAGVRAAVDGFELGGERPRAIAVFSDGEDPGRGDAVGASHALGAQARVVAFAFGGETGSAIPDGDQPLRDRGGRVVVSRRATARLARLTDATGGVTFAADRWGAFDFDAATRELRREARGVAGEPVERKVAAVRVAPFAALGLALLLAEGLPRIRVRPRRARRASAAALGASLLLGASGGVPQPPSPRVVEEIDLPPPEVVEAALRSRPHDPRLLYELGRSRLAHGQPDRAAAAFAAAGAYARDPRVTARSRFALGVSELERGELERARDAFFDALALDPHDARARFNLEWTLLALHREPPEPTPVELPEPPRERPEPPESERPEPQPEVADPSPQPDAAGPTPAPALTDAQRRRALARVRDDLRPALRAAASGDARTDAPGPAW